MRKTIRLTFTLLLAGLLSPVLPGQVSFTGFDKIISDAGRSIPLSGSSIRLMQSGKLLHEKTFGNVIQETVVPILSSSKWLVSALIMTLVDENKLALDDPVSKYVVSWRGERDFKKITVRQCLNHSSGLPPYHEFLNMSWIKISQAVDNLPLATKLVAKAGLVFHYGQLSYQVAGRVAEIAGGKPWKTLIRERLFRPLGMSKTDFNAFGKVTNPVIALAAQSSLRDYSAFVEMCRNRGLHRGERILTEASIAEMFKNQIKGLHIIDHPYRDARPYGLGVYIDRQDSKGRVLQVSHQGGFGFSPWIDFDRDQSAVFLVQDNFYRILPLVDELQLWLRERFHPPGVITFGSSSDACAGSMLMRAESSPRAEENSFRIACRNAPPFTLGGLILGLSSVRAPFEILGAKIYISPLGGPILVPIISDQNGAHATNLPLSALPKGAQFFAQYQWMNTADCRGSGLLSASNAMQVTTR